MTVASLDLCKELYELSGWDITHLYWAERQRPDAPQYVRKQLVHRTQANSGNEDVTPTYDLGYLLEKLPHATSIYKREFDYVARNAHKGKRTVVESTDAPTALCKLAIQLFKEGILK